MKKINNINVKTTRGYKKYKPIKMKRERDMLLKTVPNARKKLDDIKRLYHLRNMTPQKIAHLSYKDKVDYYKIEKQILSGQFERKKAMLFKKNYINAMFTAGCDLEAINRVSNKLKHFSTKEIKAIARILPTINMIYPDKEYEFEDQLDAITSDIETILDI